MRLTNKQLDIIVDEIYKQVSVPIMKKNEKLVKEVKLPKNDQYLKDQKIYEDLQIQIDRLADKQDEIIGKYRRKSYNDFEFGYSPMQQRLQYVTHLKWSKVTLAEYPSKTDIEKQVILSGNSDIPELIKQVVTLLKEKCD